MLFGEVGISAKELAEKLVSGVLNRRGPMLRRVAEAAEKCGRLR